MESDSGFGQSRGESFRTPLALCGEIAGNTRQTAQILHAGIREVSTYTRCIAAMRKAAIRIAIDTQQQGFSEIAVVVIPNHALIIKAVYTSIGLRGRRLSRTSRGRA